MKRPQGKSTFAVFFANRGFFPPELMSQARKELSDVLKKLGHEIIMLGEDATKYGAVGDVQEAQIYANFLKKNKGKYQGVILTLPNFGDESAAVAALREADVPILVHGYPDDLDKMAPELRRDSFCGKFSVMDVFCQYGLKFSALKPHVVSPKSKIFAQNIEHFDRVCRVVSGFKNMVVGAIGARTTAFKTVRIDELALQKNDITMEVIDLSEVFHRMATLKPTYGGYKEKAQSLKEYTTWKGVPDEAFDKIVRLGVVLDQLCKEWNMDALAVRCWIEMQRQLKFSPCVLLSEMNDRKIPTACEVDIGNAVTMYALSRASGNASACLDWNNNYGDDENKCILFHCGSAAQSLMTAKGRVVDHSILANDPFIGPNCSFGCNVGRIAPTPFAFGSMTTKNGNLEFYLGQGKFTKDKIPSDYFGCAGVAEFENLQDILLFVGKNGHRHHVSITPGERLVEPVKEALEYYLGYNVSIPVNNNG